MLCRWSAFSCVSSECEPPSPLLQSRKERSGFLKSRLLIFGMPWGLLTPSQVWLLREGAKKEKLCRESQSRRNQAFKPNWLAASTDALALKTLPFALNECLRLTTLLLSSQQKKKQQISWDWRFWSRWRVDQPLPLCRSSPAPNNVQQGERLCAGARRKEDVDEPTVTVHPLFKSTEENSMERFSRSPTALDPFGFDFWLSV